MQNVITNPQLEAAILATLMLYNEQMDAVAEILTPECFYSEANAAIFSAIRN